LLLFVKIVKIKVGASGKLYLLRNRQALKVSSNMASGSRDEFLAVLERSKLLKPEEFAEVQRLAQEANDPPELAKTLVRKGILTRWQAGQLLAGRSKCTVGKYKLLELLGRGGMGSVYLGEHVMMNRRVALKIIPRHIGKDPAGLERFLAEARTIASLDHPNIVQAYSVDNEGDQYYLVMEYVEGLDLHRLVEAEGPLDCASAVDYVRQAADGLAHSHSRNMVHCDIKPSNLIVNPQGVVKILDMGLARLTNPGQANGEISEQDERILGSVDYMAPEQALHTVDFNHRADIYSLGCTLYFLLTGHAPFPDGTLPERILKHQTQEPKPISAERSDVPQSLIEICKKMMSKRPAARYQTAAELSQVLAAWRPGEKRVQRVLQLKKAEPVDELPGPDLLGTDLSELFRKGMGASSTAPLIARKPPPSRLDKLPAALRPLLSTPLRAIATLGISAAVIIFLAIGLIVVFSSGNAGTTVAATGDSPETKPAEDTSPTHKTEDANTKKTETDSQVNGKETKPKKESEAPPAPTEVIQPSMESTAQSPPKPTQPIPPQQQEQPQPEPPKTEALKELAASVDLPDITKTDVQKTVSLGKVVLAPGMTLQLVLIGGDKAVKSSDSIIMIPARQSQLWQVYAETASKENSDPPRQTEIAELRIVAGNLMFNWMPNVTAAYADALRNCGMLAFAQGQQQFVQLCRPRLAEPLVLDMDSGVAKVILPTGWPPESGSLRVQITDRDPVFPPNALQPSDTIEVKTEGESEITLAFTEEKFANFNVKITAEIAGQKLELKATAYYKISQVQMNKITEPQLKIFKSAEALSANNEFNKRQPVLQDTFDKAREGSARKKEAGKNLDLLKKAQTFLQDLDGLYQTSKNKGKIHYRVFILYGKDNKVELFNTQVPVVQPTEVNVDNQNTAPQTGSETQPPKKPSKKPSTKKKSP
jgi:serine/threonine protein kinase